MLLVTRAAPLRSRSVIFVNRYFYPDQSATSQLLTDLVRALGTRGFSVQVVCSRQLYDDPTARLPARECLFGARIHRVAATRFGRYRLLGRALDFASFYASSACMLLKILKRGDTLVVKTDPPLMALPAKLIAVIRRALLVNWQQDVFPEVASHLGANPLPVWLDAGLRRLRDASLRGSHMNVVIGRRMQEFFAARGIPRSKLCIIENWADEESIRPKPSADSNLRAHLGLGDQFVAVYSGNLGRAHEFETLLAAADMLQRDHHFVFLIIGGGVKMVALKRAVQIRGLSNFRFLPYQPRECLEDSLAAGDVHLACLLPMLEGLIVPSKLYGILAAGRPLIFIGEADGDVGQVIGAARCGLSVDVGDAQGLVAALRYLQAEPGVRVEMGRRARALFCDKYTVAKAVDRWIAVLES